jgi:hypothetical protein
VTAGGEKAGARVPNVRGLAAEVELGTDVPKAPVGPSASAPTEGDPDGPKALNGSTPGGGTAIEVTANGGAPTDGGGAKGGAPT